MAKFNLEAAKNGAKVITKEGYNVKIICWDAKGNYPLIGLIDVKCQEEVISRFTIDGISSFGKYFDLYMSPQKITKWANVYKNKNTFDGGYKVGNVCLYDSEEEALNEASVKNYIKTVEISWEE